MSDADGYNIPMLGHRRWVLNPGMGQTGFGMVGKYCAMFSFDESNRYASESRVAWPAQLTPVSLFGQDDPWSLSMGTRVDRSSVRVTLTRQSDGRVWSFSAVSSQSMVAREMNNDGYGQPGCIIFRPAGLGGCRAGDVFRVQVTGAAADTVEYTVRFFDMDAPLPAPTPVPVTPTPVPLSVAISADASRAHITGDFSGLYARAALVLTTGGKSGLYVTQATVHPDGTVDIPQLVVPGMRVTGISVALVRTLEDITSPTPRVVAVDFIKI